MRIFDVSSAQCGSRNCLSFFVPKSELHAPLIFAHPALRQADTAIRSINRMHEHNCPKGFSMFDTRKDTSWADCAEADSTKTPPSAMPIAKAVQQTPITRSGFSPKLLHSVTTSLATE
jgi:hypothetical protein